MGVELARRPVQGNPSVTVQRFQETGEISRRWAVESTRKGQLSESWLAPQQAVAAEDPSDTALRNVLCGVAEAFDTERLCRRCGPLPQGDERPLCPECGGRIETVRIVTRRSDPVEYGPEIRWEEREIELKERLDAEGKTMRDKRGRVKYDEITRSKCVKRGSWAEFRRAVADDQERETRQRLKIAGNRSPDRVFLLPRQ